MKDFCRKHPVVVLGILFVICVLFAKGDSALMSPIDLGIVFGCLAVFLSCICGFKPAITAAAGTASGVAAGISGFLIGNSNPVLTFGGTFLLLLAAVYIAVKKKDDHETIIVLLLAASFWLQLCYIQYTPHWVRQNDVCKFRDDYFEVDHSGYISFIMRSGWIPNIDVRKMIQWYHPPLHHLISAYFLRFYGAVFPGYKENYDVLQTLSLVYTSVTVIYIRKIIKLFDISEKTDKYITFLLVFFPVFIFKAGEINNDPLSIMLFILSVYNIFKWYREDYKIRYLIGSAFAIGLGMMTKLSVWMAAVPVGTVLLASLIRTKGKSGRLWGQYGLFALISLPLGLWFPIRNYICWGVPLSYIPVPLYEDSLEKYSVFARLFDVIDNKGNYNILSYTLWTALFDSQDYRSITYLGLLSYFISKVFIVIVLAAVAGIFCLVVKAVKNKKAGCELTALILLLIVELVSYVIFCFKYPYYCTMNFRYIIPVTIIFALGLCSLYDTGNKYVKTGINLFTVLFAASVSVFYLTLWMF